MRKNIIKLKDIKLSFHTLVELFINFKTAQGLAKRTLRDYKTTFDEFQKYYQEEYADELKIKNTLYEYFKTKSNKAPATFNRPYQCLMCFFEWCVAEQYLFSNPLKDSKLKKIKDEGNTRHQEPEIIKLLLDSFDLTTYSGLRNYALVVLTIDTGIRPSEALSLKINDMQGSSVKIRRETAKTRTQRILPISPACQEILQKLISYKNKTWIDNIFLTSEGKPLTTDRWQKILKQASEKIGHNVTPYTLRHTFAITFLNNGGNVFALQKEMGHTSLDMTKRYIKLADKDVKEQHTKASPLNNILQRTTKIRKILK